MGLFSTTNLYGMTIRESANDGSDFTNPDADYRRLFLGEDGILHLKDSAGTVTDLSAGAMATDALWDAKGDLAAGTGANTGAKLTVGANDTILMADSAQSTGLKWVASQTPSTQAYSDAAAEGTADTYARGDHKHAMPAASSAAFAGARASHSTTQSLTTATFTAVLFDTTDVQSDTQMHYTSAANLTGTVTKNATTAIVGSSTLFTSELTVGQVISVPGTAAEKRVVTVITDNTHLTVSTAFANSASGQTATRINSAIVIPSTQKITLIGGVTFASNATGVRQCYWRKNDTGYQAPKDIRSATAAGNVTAHIVVGPISVTQWDFFEMVAYQDSGGALNIGGTNDAASVGGFIGHGA